MRQPLPHISYVAAIIWLSLALGATPQPPAYAGWDSHFRAAEYYRVARDTSAWWGSEPFGIATADFDGNGRPDFVLTISGPIDQPLANRVALFMHSQNSDQPRLFTAMAPTLIDDTGFDEFLVGAYGVAVADFNLDGKQDFVATTNKNGTGLVLSVRRQVPGGWAPSKKYTVSGLQTLVATADWNGDGRFDVIADIGSGVAFLRSVNGDSLAPAVTFTVPSVGNLSAMVVADATGDGVLDAVLITNPDAPSMWIIQGDGAGGASATIGPFNVEAWTPGLVVGFLNSDAIPDISVTAASPGHVSVYFGTGGGAFQPPVHLSANIAPEALCAGDIDGDADLDLVALTSGFEGTLSSAAVFRNNGTGSFAPAAMYGGLPGSGRRAVLVDVNLDGRLDIVAPTRSEYGGRISNTLGILLNDGSGGFRGGTLGAPNTVSYREAMADFNRDGNLDLAVVRENWVEVALGNGNGTFGAPASAIQTSGVTASRILAADMNRDGNVDIIIGNPGVGTQVYRASGGSFLLAATLSGSAEPAAVLDLDRDGLLDILTDNSGTTVTPYRNVTVGGLMAFTFQTAVFPTCGVKAVANGDWNRDGIPDVVVVGGTGLSTYLGVGNGALGPEVAYSVGRSYTAVCAADFDRDGDLDLAVREVSPVMHRGVDIWLGSGAGSFSLTRSLPTITRRGSTMASWDVNLDGMPDLVTSNESEGAQGVDPLVSAEVLLGNGGGDFAESVGYSMGVVKRGGSTHRPLTIGDADRNGAPDIMAGSSDFNLTSQPIIHTVLATPPLKDNGMHQASFYTTLSNPGRVAIGDLNRDGKPDIVTSTFGTTPAIGVHMGDGSGIPGPLVPLNQSWYTSQIGLADFNRDGILDVAASNAGIGAPRVSTMLGVGDGTFGARNDFYINAGLDFEMGDINRDGKPDIVTASQDSIQVLLGTGTGTFTAGARAASTLCYDLDLADLNRDGYLDIVWAAGTVKVIYGAANGALGAPVTLPAPLTNCQTLCVADFNRDGFLDIAANNFNIYYISWGAAVSPFSTYATTTLTFTASDMKVGEMEANGLPFLYASRSAEFLEILTVSPAGVLGTFGSYLVSNTPEALALGDLNRDGGLDVVCTGSGGSWISVNLHGFNLVTAVEAPAPLVARARLRQNYPNPFNPRTTIRYALPRSERAHLAIFDVQGRLVATLKDGIQPAGEHAVEWDGRNRQGASVASGVYLYQLSTESGEHESKRMVIVK